MNVRPRARRHRSLSLPQPGPRAPLPRPPARRPPTPGGAREPHSPPAAPRVRAAAPAADGLPPRKRRARGRGEELPAERQVGAAKPIPARTAPRTPGARCRAERGQVWGPVTTSPKSCHTKLRAARKCFGTCLNSKTQPSTSKVESALSYPPPDYPAITSPASRPGRAETRRTVALTWEEGGPRGAGLCSHSPPFLSSGMHRGEAKQGAGWEPGLCHPPERGADSAHS